MSASRLQQKNIKSFFGAAASVALTLAFLAGCATTPKSEQTVVGAAGSAEGQWRGKAMVRNWKTGKNGVLDIDILAREPSQLRMEITGTFGVHVASVALNDGEVTTILTQEKRFVRSPAGENALVRLVPVRIPPGALLAVLFERELPAADWKCDRSADSSLPVFCAHRSGEIGVKWLERNGRNRRLKITSKEADIEFVIDQAKSKVEFNKDAFTLAPPSGYKEERLTSG